MANLSFFFVSSQPLPIGAERAAKLAKVPGDTDCFRSTETRLFQR
jgi:hypothetical protein